MKTVDVLSTDTTGWALVKEWITSARNKIEILPAEPQKAKEALYQTQVSTHSIMGAVIYNTGGILIDNGWLRILGSGNAKLDRSLPSWNKGKTFKDYGEKPGFLLIADDIIGGFFAINGGELGQNLGNIYYLAPDRLKWEDLKMGYTDFIKIFFVIDMNQFYHQLRWSKWDSDIKGISGDQGFFYYPPLWTKEGKDISKNKRSVAPINEIYTFEINAIKQVPQH